MSLELKMLGATGGRPNYKNTEEEERKQRNNKIKDTAVFCFGRVTSATHEKKNTTVVTTGGRCVCVCADWAQLSPPARLLSALSPFSNVHSFSF